MGRFHWIAGCIAFATTRLAAAADTHLALERYVPTPAGDTFFSVAAPSTMEDFAVHSRLTLDWAHDPLVLYSATNTQDVRVIVGNQLFANLGGAVELKKRFTFSADLPVAVTQNGNDITSAGAPRPAGAHVGDLRLGGRAQLVAVNELLRFAIGGYAWAPIGSSSSHSGAFVSDGAWRGSAQLAAYGDSGRFVWAFNAGPEFRTQQTFLAVHQGTMLRVAAAAAMRFLEQRALQVGPEVNTGVTLSHARSYNVNVEALLGARYDTPIGLVVGVAAGRGLTNGIGTPDTRVILTAAYSFTPAPAASAPPQQTPIVELAPTPEPRPAEHPVAVALASAAPTTEPAIVEAPHVEVVGDQVVTLEQIEFETNGDVIKAESEPLLQSILAVIQGRPKTDRFSVEGHTDSRGTAKRNKALSAARARAVVRWLVAHGQSANRFATRGFGSSRPIVTCSDDAGCRRNRRVEIHIVE